METKIIGLPFCPVCGCSAQEYNDFVVFGGTCPCCAFEFGIDESNLGDDSFIKYRNRWINNGMKFMSPTENQNWNLNQLLNNLKNLKFLDINKYFLSEKASNKNWTSHFDENEIIKLWHRFRSP